MNFTHLHMHTGVSPDGMGRISDLVEFLKENEYKAAAITDHGTIAAWPEFYAECKRHGIKPIAGIEGYIVPDSRLNIGGRVKANHITLLAKNWNGYQNLINLDTESHRSKIENGTRFPLMNFDMLQEFSQDLIILTGCPASLTYDEDFNVAYTYVETLIKLIGRENVFAEIMFSVEGHDFFSRPLELSKELGIKSVVTNDSHYLKKGDKDIHFACIAATLGVGFATEYPSERLFVASPDDIKEWAKETTIDLSIVEESINNTMLVSDMIEEFSIEQDVQLPPVDEDLRNEVYTTLYSELEKYIEKHSGRFDKEFIQARFDKELKVIESIGFQDYFAVVYDIVKFVRSNNHLCTTRGSASGSLINYLLKFSIVDPLVLDLPFERFLNTARNDFPDIDLDISSSFRQEVVKYCEERWNMKQVATMRFYRHDSLVNDLAKSFDVDFEDAILLKEYSRDDELWTKYQKKNPRFVDAYDIMINQPNGFSTHAAAMASIGETNLPLESWTGNLQIAFNESGVTHAISMVGGIKFDILGIIGLTRLEEIMKLTNLRPPEDYYEDFPFEPLCKGHLLGIFQLDGSPMMKKMAMDIQIHSIDDIIAAISLFRPGALDAGTAEHYVEYKKKPRQLHPDVDKVLESTYGVIIYQEQVMELFALITHGDPTLNALEQGDLARRKISAKTSKLLTDPNWLKDAKIVEEKFKKEGQEKGYDKALLDQLWAEMFAHSRYSFNKAHAASYAEIARQLAWYMHNVPEAYYAGCLNALLLVDKLDGVVQDYLLEMFRYGVKLNRPSVLHSEQLFTIKNNELYLPLQLVGFFKEKEWEALSWLKKYLSGDSIADNDIVINGEDYYEGVKERLTKLEIAELNYKAISALSSGSIWNSRVKKFLLLSGAFRDLPGSPDELVVKIQKTKTTYSGIELTEDEQKLDTPFKIQAYTMKIIIPTEEMVDMFESVEKYTKYDENGEIIYKTVGGIVTTITNKKTKTGKPKKVYRLTGNVTITESLQREYVEPFNFEVGTPLIARVNKYSYIMWENKKKEFLVKTLW